MNYNVIARNVKKTITLDRLLLKPQVEEELIIKYTKRYSNISFKKNFIDQLFIKQGNFFKLNTEIEKEKEEIIDKLNSLIKEITNEQVPLEVNEKNFTYVLYVLIKAVRFYNMLLPEKRRRLGHEEAKEDRFTDETKEKETEEEIRNPYNIFINKLISIISPCNNLDNFEYDSTDDVIKLKYEIFSLKLTKAIEWFLNVTEKNSKIKNS